MEKLKPKISKKVKKVLSSVLAATLVLGSVPASTFLGDAIQVRAAASYSPQKYGVGVLCRDLTTGDKAKEIFNALVRCKSKKEDSLYGSIYNNVGMVKYKYNKTKAGSGKTFSVNVQKDYPVLYNQSGQISQNLMAYINIRISDTTGETGRSTEKLSLVIRPVQIITVSGSGRATIQAIIIQMEAGRSGIVIPGQHFGHRWDRIKEQLSM